LVNSHPRLTGPFPLHFTNLLDNEQIKKAKRVIVIPRVGDSSGDPELYQPIDSISSFLVRPTPFFSSPSYIPLILPSTPQMDSVLVSNKVSSKNRSKRPVVRPTEWTNSSVVADVRMVKLENISGDQLSIPFGQVTLQATQRFSAFGLDHHSGDSGASSCCYAVEIAPRCSAQSEQTPRILVSHCLC
jgi:hypothetical protein